MFRPFSVAIKAQEVRHTCKRLLYLMRILGDFESDLKGLAGSGNGKMPTPSPCSASSSSRVGKPLPLPSPWQAFSPFFPAERLCEVLDPNEVESQLGPGERPGGGAIISQFGGAASAPFLAEPAFPFLPLPFESFPFPVPFEGEPFLGSLTLTFLRYSSLE